MSEFVNFVTILFSFCGFGCDTVDTAFQDDPDNPRRERWFHSPLFWFWAEKILLVPDIANFIFDLLFAEEATWDTVMLAATVTAFIGTILLGKGPTLPPFGRWRDWTLSSTSPGCCWPQQRW